LQENAWRRLITASAALGPVLAALSFGAASHLTILGPMFRAASTKKFSAVRMGEGCKEMSFVCTTDIGEGVFQPGYIGLGMMVKHAKRFPDRPGPLGLLQLRPSTAGIPTTL
jgi:hypothetical protein